MSRSRFKTVSHLFSLLIITAMTVLQGSATAQNSGSIDSSLFKGLEARLVGPAGMSGRIAAVDSLASDPNFIVVGASTGGLWISRNGGLNWTPVFDDMPVGSIGAVAINQKNPDIIWVGTGEGNVRNSTSIGAGVFKSVDGGKTFEQVGLVKTERINRIALHPDNSNIAYVAAMGKLWGENAERGIYKTEDGGKTWQRKLYVDQKTGATDVQMVPGNPDKLFVSMWQFRRWPYFFKSGGAGSGLYVSHDGGDNWSEITQEDGLPKGELGRSAFAISKSNPERVYALIEAEKSALARSDDGGRSWSLVNQDFDINDRPFYYNDLAVDPKDPNRVYRIGSRVKVSIDGGRNFEFIPAINCCAASNTVHIDTHAWWINPNDPRHMIDGNDGGIAITHDQGATWRFVRNLPLAQFYHIAVDNAHPYNIYGGLQDNGSWRGPSEVWEQGGIRNFHWREVAFGDGFDTRPDPDDPEEGYAMSQGGSLYRWSMKTGELRLIAPPSPNKETQLRFNWNAGLAQDPFDAATIYYGSQFVHKSTDRGLNWEVVSDDLTTNNAEFQTFTSSGGLTPDVTAAENYTSITIIAPSPIEKGVIWVGTDDGRVHVTRDGGETWSSVEGRARNGIGGSPKGGWVTNIAPSPHDASVAFITIDDHRRGNNQPFVYQMSNFGQSWRSLVTRDVSGYALSILQDPVDQNLLFLGTEFGLYVSLNGGRQWTKWTAGVPTASVMDMAIQERESDLVLGTHGRAAFVIDDYSALRGLSASDFNKRLSLLSVGDGQQYNAPQAASTRFPGSGEFRSPNEAYGVIIRFMASGDDLPHPDDKLERERLIDQRSDNNQSGADSAEEKPSAEKPMATVEVMNGEGTLIRTFKQEVHQGINQAVWNMRQDGNPVIPPGEPAKDGTLPPGLAVLPGDYKIVVKFDGEEEGGAAKVLADPRSPYSAADRKANFDMQMEASQLSKAAGDALRRILEARDDTGAVSGLIAIAKKADDVDSADEDHPLNKLEKQAGELKKSLTNLEKKFRVPPKTKGIVFNDDKVFSKIGAAQFYLSTSNDRPVRAAAIALEEAKTAVDGAIADLNQILENDLPALAKAVDDQGLGLLKQKPIQ